MIPQELVQYIWDAAALARGGVGPDVLCSGLAFIRNAIQRDLSGAVQREAIAQLNAIRSMVPETVEGNQLRIAVAAALEDFAALLTERNVSRVA
jgi:hypothetical protein